MTKESWQFNDQVAKGMKLLDERVPGWMEKVELSELDLGSDCACILGQTSIQLGGSSYSYGEAVRVLFPNTPPSYYRPPAAVIEHGFYASNPDDYPALTQAWNNAIVARRRETAV
jgi:hypothetical protein